MALDIRFSPFAQTDLDEIRARMTVHHPAVVEIVISRILQSIGYLGAFPRLGQPGLVPETWELSIYGLPYKAVYRIGGDMILIFAIVHAIRQFP